MKFNRIYAIALKEVYHVLRDPFTIGMALVLPVILTIIFGLAIEFNIQNIKMAVQDKDKTYSSRRLIDSFGSSDFFEISGVTSPEAGIERIQSGRSKAFLVIDPLFEYALLSNRPTTAQVLLDGSDNSTVGPTMSYIQSIERMTTQKITGQIPQTPIDLKTRFLFNPELSSRWFIIPGLLVVVQAILSILLTSLTVAREWENGSMELLLSTPTRPVEIILGKLFPYVVLGLGAMTFIYLVARFAFEIPFRGNHFVFILGALIFLATYLAQGILISVVTRSQRLAMQLSMLMGLLPSMLLSGFIFPVESMPTFFQYFTMILPARWFMVIARDSFLKGSSVLDLKTPFIALVIICTFMVLAAATKFKKDLEP